MFCKIPPHPSLEKVIDYYWVEKNGRSSIKVLPDGTARILFNLGNPIKIINAEGERNTLQGNWIVGSYSRYYVMEQMDNTHIIGVKFKQGGAFCFIKLPIHRFTNKVVEFSKILNGESIEMTKLLLKSKCEQDVKKYLDRYFIVKIDTYDGAFDIVDFTISKVKVNGSPALIKNLCQAANISNKHLITLFNEKVGLSPKLIHRINKFLKVVDFIHKDNDNNWIEIAYQCEYYDQAHLINDFRYFSGLSPKKYADLYTTEGLRILIP